MNPDQWQQVERIFHAALERDAAERDCFLKEECDDELVRREVASLLANHKTDNLLEGTALEEAARLLAEDQARVVEGQTISHYRLLSRMGAGGMGEVYLARDTRLGRKVALKLLTSELTQSRDRLRRFRRRVPLQPSITRTS